MVRICQCPTPPGGQATCGDNQLAICRVVNGVAHTECIDIPTNITLNSLEGHNWVLSKVMQTPRPPQQRVRHYEQIIIDKKRYRIPGTNDSTTFSIPNNTQRSISDSDN